ncbi:MAG: cytidine/deoxycytidylate deaminase family protein [Actinomycetota bacterium]|nr:dCMP deaminase family protein [Actinomycetota bacterium]
MPTTTKTRADWDTYFLNLARQAATRSSCTQSKHGAVIVSKRHIQSTGYNGTPSGYGHCDQGACPRGRKGDLTKPCWGLHAEANAILYAEPERREGATLYITSPPCLDCAKLIANSGLREVVAAEGEQPDVDKVKKFLLDCKVRFRIIETEPTNVRARKSTT